MDGGLHTMRKVFLSMLEISLMESSPAKEKNSFTMVATMKVDLKMEYGMEMEFNFLMNSIKRL